MPFYFQCQLLAHEKLILSMKDSINQVVVQVSAQSTEVPITGNSQVLSDTIPSPTSVTSLSAGPFSLSKPFINHKSYSEAISVHRLRSEDNVQNRPSKHSPERKFNNMDWMSYQMVHPDFSDSRVTLTALHPFSLVLFLPSSPMQPETTIVLESSSRIYLSMTHLGEVESDL